MKNGDDVLEIGTKTGEFNELHELERLLSEQMSLFLNTKKSSDDDEEVGKGRFYAAYVEKRDARLKQKQSEKLKKASELKLMLHNLEISYHPNDHDHHLSESFTKFYRNDKSSTINNTSSSDAAAASSVAGSRKLIPRRSLSSSSSTKQAAERRTAPPARSNSNSKQSIRFARSNSSTTSATNGDGIIHQQQPKQSLKTAKTTRSRRSASYGGAKDVSEQSMSVPEPVDEHAGTRKKWGIVERPALLTESRNKNETKGLMKLFQFMKKSKEFESAESVEKKWKSVYSNKLIHTRRSFMDGKFVVA